MKEARNRDEIPAAFEFGAEGPPDGLIVFDDPVIWGLRSEVVAHVRRAKLPAVYGYTEFVDAGGLISLGPDRRDHYRRTARYVDGRAGADRPQLPA